MRSKRLMIIDDDNMVLKIIKNAFEKTFDLSLFSSPIKALKVLENKSFDIIIVDIKMSEVDGIQFIRKVKKKYPEQKFIIITGFSSLIHTKELLNLEVPYILGKPFSLERLREMIEEYLNKKEIISKNVNVGLLAFLRTLAYDKKSSIIKIKAKENKGIIYIEKGILKKCEFKGLEGIEAIKEILKLKDYTYTKLTDLPIKAKISIPIEHALMEALRPIDETNKKDRENQKRYKSFDELNNKLKNNLEDGLISMELLHLPDSSLFNYRIDKYSYAVFNNLTSYLKKGLASIGMPCLRNYYLIDAKDGNTIIIVPLHNYMLGLCIDTKKYS